MYYILSKIESDTPEDEEVQYSITLKSSMGETTLCTTDLQMALARVEQCREWNKLSKCHSAMGVDECIVCDKNGNVLASYNYKEEAAENK